MFQTVDTDFSPGDPPTKATASPTPVASFRPLTRISLLVTVCPRIGGLDYCVSFRPLTRISLLVTGTLTNSPNIMLDLFQTVDTDFSPGDFFYQERTISIEQSFRPLTRISLLVTGGTLINARWVITGFRPLTRISLLVTLSSNNSIQSSRPHVSDR